MALRSKSRSRSRSRSRRYRGSGGSADVPGSPVDTAEVSTEKQNGGLDENDAPVNNDGVNGGLTGGRGRRGGRSGRRGGRSGRRGGRSGGRRGDGGRSSKSDGGGKVSSKTRRRNAKGGFSTVFADALVPLGLLWAQNLSKKNKGHKLIGGKRRKRRGGDDIA